MCNRMKTEGKKEEKDVNIKADADECKSGFT